MPRLPPPAGRRAGADRARRRAVGAGHAARPPGTAVPSRGREGSHPGVVAGAPAARVGGDGRARPGNRKLPRQRGGTGPPSRDGNRQCSGAGPPTGSAGIPSRGARHRAHATRGCVRPCRCLPSTGRGPGGQHRAAPTGTRRIASGGRAAPRAGSEDRRAQGRVGRTRRVAEGQGHQLGQRETRIGWRPRRRSRRAGRGLLPGSRRRLLRRRDRPAGARFEHDDRGDERTARVAARPGRGLGGGGRATRRRKRRRVAAPGRRRQVRRTGRGRLGPWG